MVSKAWTKAFKLFLAFYCVKKRHRTGIFIFLSFRIQVKASVKVVKSHPLGHLPPYLPTWRRTALAPGRLDRRLERAFSRSVAAKRQQITPTSVRANCAGMYLLHQVAWCSTPVGLAVAYWGVWYLRNVFLPFTTFYFLKTHPKNIGRGHNLPVQNGSCLIMDVPLCDVGPSAHCVLHDLRPVVISITISAPFLVFCFCWPPVIVLLHMKTAAGVPVRLC